MSTEFNYVARLDTSQIMSGLSEIRSQVGMTLGGAGGFGGGTLSQTNFGGGASMGMSQMMNSFAGGFGTPGLGGTFTDPAMAYSPHYGMQGAATSLQQEGLIMNGGGGRTGMEWAGRFAPPGVSAGEFAFAAFGNNLDRSIQSREAASLAGGSALASSAGGLLAGEAAQALAAPIGAFAGAKIASRMFGAGAAGAGAAIGGLALGFGAFSVASDLVGGKIQEHYADIEQTLGVTRELGSIVGGGRGLSRTQQYDLGVAARDAAGSMKMDVNQMGDIMSLAREGGMLPTSLDPGKAKQQIIDFATAITEASQTLHSSLATARDVIKSASQQGLTIEEGTLRARMGTLDGGGGGWMAGMQQQVASSPLGTLQIMAARGGQPLGGIMDLPGQALEAMSQGGDMVSNMGKFMVHEHEYRKGMGSKGVSAMAEHQLESMGDLMSELMPGMSGNEAKRMAAMQMYGMSGADAQRYVGGMGGGKGDGYARALALAEQDREGQMGRLTSGLNKLPGTESEGIGWGQTMNGAMIGGTIGSMVPIVGTAVGAVVGGAAGFLGSNASALWHGAGDIASGIGDLFRGSGEAADRRGYAAAARYDQSEQGVKDKLGILPIDVSEDTARGMTANLRGVTLQMDRQVGGIATSHVQNMSEAALRIAGLTPVAPGPGTIAFSGGVAFSAAAVQKFASSYGGSALDAKGIRKAENLAYEIFHDPGAVKRFAAGETAADFAGLPKPWGDMNEAEQWQQSIGNQVAGLNQTINTLAKPSNSADQEGYQMAATTFNGQLQKLARGIKDPRERQKFLGELTSGTFLSENSPARLVLEKGGVHIDQLKGLGAQARQTLGIAVHETMATQTHHRANAIAKVIGAGGADRADVDAVVSEIVKDDQFAEIERRSASGERGKAIDDAFKAVVQRGKVRSGVKGDRDVIDMSNVSLSTQFLQTDEATGKKFVSSLGEDLALHDKKLNQTGVAKRRGPEVQSRAIGFGEQEQAMSSINRSLQRTHSMITALDKKISGSSGTAPAADNQAPGPAMAGDWGR